MTSPYRLYRRRDTGALFWWHQDEPRPPACDVEEVKDEPRDTPCIAAEEPKQQTLFGD